MKYRSHAAAAWLLLNMPILVNLIPWNANNPAVSFFSDTLTDQIWQKNRYVMHTYFNNSLDIMYSFPGKIATYFVSNRNSVSIWAPTDINIFTFSVDNIDTFTSWEKTRKVFNVTTSDVP